MTQKYKKKKKPTSTYIACIEYIVRTVNEGATVGMSCKWQIKQEIKRNRTSDSEFYSEWIA